MSPNIFNDQDYLAEKFRMEENQLIQASRVAHLKIQSWKFAMTNPDVGRGYQQEANQMINRSLLSFVPNSFILSEEGYYFSCITN